MYYALIHTIRYCSVASESDTNFTVYVVNLDAGQMCYWSMLSSVRQHIFIPLLPPHLIDYCTAPMPFVIGIHTSLLKVHLHSTWLRLKFKCMCTEHPQHTCLYYTRNYKKLHVHRIFCFQKLRMSELGDAIILDADQNTILTEHSDLEKLPNDVVTLWSLSYCVSVYMYLATVHVLGYLVFCS